MQTLNRSNQESLLPGNWRISQIPGLSPDDQAQLEECGIKTTLQLLKQCNSLSQRQALATRLRVHIHHVNKWVALADLARIPSVGCQYCGLLLHVGIVSSTQLAQTPLYKLHQQILRFQVATLQRRDLCPSKNEMQTWIQQARSLSQLTQSGSK